MASSVSSSGRRRFSSRNSSATLLRALLLTRETMRGSPLGRLSSNKLISGKCETGRPLSLLVAESRRDSAGVASAPSSVEASD